MIAAIERLARALGVHPGEDYTLDDLVERATFLRQFCEARYQANSCTSDDLEAARQGLSDPAVGRVLAALNRDASRHATTEPGDPPGETDEEPERLPDMRHQRPLPKIEET